LFSPAVGTILAGPALDSVKVGKAYSGEAAVLGTTYVGDYEPITEASAAVIGAYFVGYKK
jgi:methyl-accepting chemotaxis protein-2 (aspartate sensor receptor)